jgi:hypothetical protein
MFKVLPVFIFSCLVSFLFSQTPIDTVDTKKGKMILYSNRTWVLLEDVNFNGVLNQHLHNLVTKDLNLGFVQNWDNDVCYTSDKANDMNKLKDTLWLCVLNESDEEFVMPVPGMLTSKYGFRKGRNHNGVDLDLNTGDTVKACWSGKVRYAKFNSGGFGNLVIVRHHNGLESFYAHLSKLMVAPNQYVAAGEPIGLGGNTGRSFGSHLHFEIRFYDAAMNPEEVIDFKERKCRDHNLFVHRSLFKPGAKPTELDDAEEVPVIEEKKVEEQKLVLVDVQQKFYRIKSGDTLAEIATRNKTTIAKICQLNGIRPTTSLQIGRNLRVK